MNALYIHNTLQQKPDSDMTSFEELLQSNLEASIRPIMLYKLQISILTILGKSKSLMAQLKCHEQP